MTASETPDSVTRRGVQEVLRSFARSEWTGMTLDIGGMRITVGKNGPPAGPAATGGVATASAPAVDGSQAPGGPATSAATPASGPMAPAPGAGPAGSASSGRGGAVPADAGVVGVPATGGPSGPPADTTGLVEVRSPAVGAFWVAPSPGQPPFVEVGQAIVEHEQLAIVEVMKLMNPVVAPQAGEVVQVCVGNAEMVEYDQVLFLIRPSDA